MDIGELNREQCSDAGAESVQGEEEKQTSGLPNLETRDMDAETEDTHVSEKRKSFFEKLKEYFE